MVKITLIHAMKLAVEPVNAAFREGWSEAETRDVLDEKLLKALARAGGMTEAIVERFEKMAVKAKKRGADGILFTCSAFGPAIEAAARRVAPLPVLKPNEAMFAEAMETGGTVGLIATFAPSIAPMAREFKTMAKATGSVSDLQTMFVFDAMDALVAGDAERHDALIAEEASTMIDCKVLMLAQFSTARAKGAVAAASGLPVLTSPESAVHALKARLGGA